MRKYPLPLKGSLNLLPCLSSAFVFKSKPMSWNALKLIGFLSVLFCNSITKAQTNTTEDASYIHRAIKKVTDVMVHDIYSPPVASRTYAYITIAGYETIIHANNDYISLTGQLHGLTSVPQPEENKQYNYTLGAVEAILTTAKSFVISEDTIEAFRQSILQEFENNGVSSEAFNNSVAYGEKIAAHILAWAANDNYKKIRSMPQYAVTDDDGSWKPTPPAYIKAIEPNWNKIRTWILDSAEQFKPPPATTFSSNKESDFYKNAMDVYNVGLHLTREQKAIANFWDCNPFKMNVRGHVMFATKKISPGGHWINITHVACEKQHADAVQSLEAYTCVAITIADAFISCWDEKYRSRVVRPETFINQFIDNDWTPLLQTPPFPEYTSGHSVVSAACAFMLSKMFGNDFAFTDSTGFEFDLPPRSFTSFKQAAQEAAISRFYGGIHYMPSINNGFDEGEKIAAFISSKLKTRKSNDQMNAS